MAPTVALSALAVINPEDGAIYSPNSSITLIADDTANGQEYLFQLVHIEIIEGLETVGIFYEDTDEEANQADTYINHACAPQLGATSWPVFDNNQARVKRLPTGNWVYQDGKFHVRNPPS